MHDARLDDRSFVTGRDPQGIFGEAEDAVGQCRQAILIASRITLPPTDRPKVVCFAGVGGSAVSGDIAQALFNASGSVPAIVARDYHLPRFVGQDDLVFCTSYSGETEETISIYREARRLGCNRIVITSGGTLAEEAAADGSPLIEIPPGLHPRSALGLLLFPLLAACEVMGLIPKQDYDEVVDSLSSCIQGKWGIQVTDDNIAKQIASRLSAKVAILFGLGGWQSAVAYRWKCQINENAKQLAFSAAYPELDHNEILAWSHLSGASESNYAGVLLTDGSESASMRMRAAITDEELSAACPFIEARASGIELLTRILTLVYLGDYVSLYLAALSGVDPGNIDAISRLKARLAPRPAP